MHTTKTKTINDVRPYARTAAMPETPKQSKLIWVGMLFVVASIAFSTYMVYLQNADWLLRALLLPQVIFGSGLLIYKFSK